MLAFWTGGDASRIDSLFRQSGLYREKWDRKNYRNRTITEALSGKTEFYKAPKTVKLADGNERKAEEKEERRNQADRLIGYILEDVQELFVDQHGAPHRLIDNEPVPLTSRCYSWLRRLMWEEEGRSVSGEYLKMAAGTLSAHAEFSGEVRELYTRAAWHEGVLYYELRPGKVVRVGSGGWTFEAKPPVLFRRYVNLKALPDPETGGSLDVLDRLVNLKSERDRRLFKAYVVTLPLEHVGRPILQCEWGDGFRQDDHTASYQAPTRPDGAGDSALRPARLPAESHACLHRHARQPEHHPRVGGRYPVPSPHRRGRLQEAALYR